MLTANMLVSEGADIIATIDPDAYSANTYTSDVFDMSKYERVIAIVMAGDLGSSATLDAKLQHGAASNLSDAEDITGKAITQLTQAGTDSDKQAVIELRPDEMKGAALSFKSGTTRYARLSMTVGVAASDCGAIVLGFGRRQGVGSDNDLASVDEVVA